MNRDLLNVVRYGWDQLEQEEGVVDSATMVAGHLVEKTANGYQPHSTGAGVVDKLAFAKDQRGRGFEAGDDVPEGDFIQYVKPNGSVGLTAVLAAGTDLATASLATVNGDEETPLVSAGDGTLRAFDSANDDRDAVVAVAKETKDNSGAAAGETALLDIEVVN